MNFTFQQKLTMAMGFVGAATSAFGALNTIMTPIEALIGTVILGFISACLGVVATVTSSQGAQIKEVRSMLGVEKVLVNEKANQTLAALATDPNEPKIGATTPAVREVLKDTAKAA